MAGSNMGAIFGPTAHSRVVVRRTFIEVVEDGEDAESRIRDGGMCRRVNSDSALCKLAAMVADADAGGSSETETGPDESTDDGQALFDSFDSSLGYSGTSAPPTSAPPSPATGYSPSPPVPADVGPLLSENARLCAENQLLWERACLLGQLQEAQTMLGLLQASASAGGEAAMDFATAGPMAGFSDGSASASADGQRRAPEAWADARTTVMLRNVPSNYTRAMLLGMLDDEGFSGCYDFLYLPVDFNSGACLGYAFVNLADPSLVERFWRTFDGYSRWMLPSRKVCRVSWSGPHQGLEAHIARYRNSPVMHNSVPDSYKPVLFSSGCRVAFPGPSKVTRAPRIRKRGDAGGRRQRAER